MTSLNSGRIKKIRGKLYDVGTSNSSFLQVAKDLSTVGVKNYYFMLEIFDPSLIGVDPYSENLTADQVMRIEVECYKNLWYYLREIVRIPDQGGEPVRYRANRGNVAQAWCFLHGIDSWLCLPRQQGKTVSMLAAISWAYSFGTSNSKIAFVNKDGDNAKSNLQIVKDIIDLLPRYLRFDQIMEYDETTGKEKIVKETRNATTMQHPITGNKIITKAKATSYPAAMNLLRGLSAPIMHYDEPEFTDYISTILDNALPTFTTAANNAKKNHALYGRVFTSTPGDPDTRAGQDAEKVLSKMGKWTEALYDKAYDPDDDEKNEVLKYVKSHAENQILYIEYSYKQIGKDDEWMRDMFSRMTDTHTAKRELLLQRLRGSSASPFDRDDIEYLISVAQHPISELFVLEHFKFDIYKELNHMIPYIVGVDCSTGTNGDNNAITIIDPYDVKPVAEFKCPYIGETMFEQLIIELVQRHLPRAILCIERNSVGDGIIDHLLKSPISRNLYYDKARDLVDASITAMESVQSMLKKQGESKKHTGVYTHGASRESMMAILKRHVAEFKDDFITQNITEDIARLVTLKSGKIAAGPGFHDDSIMSYLIGMYVYYHGDNLAAFGFIKGSKEIEKQNKGLDFVDLRSSGVLPEVEIKMMEQRQAAIEENNYEKIMREAMIAAQNETRKLASKGIIHSELLDNTPDDVLGSNYYNEEQIPMDFFDEINGF